MPVTRTAAVTVAVALGVLTFGYRYLTYIGFANDHFVHLSIAQQLLTGDLPVRDFVERGLPLMSALSAAAQRVLGDGLKSELTLVAFAFAVAAVLTFVAALRASGSIVFGALAAIATVLAYPASYGYPKVLPYAAAFAVAASYVARPTTPRLTALAIATAAAFLLRHDHAVLLGSGVAALLAVTHRPWSRAAGAFGRFALITLLLVGPYLGWVQMHQGLTSYFADGIAFSRRESERDSSWRLPTFGIDRGRPLFVRVPPRGPVVNVRWAPEVDDAVREERERTHRLTRLDPVDARTWQYELGAWSSAALRRLVADPAVEDTHGIDRRWLRLLVPAPMGMARFGSLDPGEGLRLRANGVTAMVYLVWILPLAALALVGARWRRVSVPDRALVTMGAAVQIGMNLTMLRDPLDTRVRDVIVPASLLMAFLLTRSWWSEGPPARRGAARVAAVLLVTIVLGASAAVGPLPDHLRESGIAHGLAGIAARIAAIDAQLAAPADRTGRIAPEYERLVAFVTACTPVQARLFTMTFAPELFFYAGRAFAGGQVSLTAGYFVGERHETLMIDRLSRQDVPLVIADSETVAEMAETYPRVAQYVGSHYDEIGRFRVSGSKDLIVMAERARVAFGTFGADALPCYSADGAGVSGPS